MDMTALRAAIAAVFAKVKELSDQAGDAATLEGQTLDQIVLLIAGEAGLKTSDVRDQLTTFAARTDNPHAVTKAQVGLGNVQDFGMADSSTVLEETNESVYVNPKVLWEALSSFWASKAGTAPETLDTINEIAAALQDNPDVIQTIQDGLATKANSTDLTDAIATVNSRIDALLASEAEVLAGTVNDKFVTPLTLKAKTDAMDAATTAAFQELQLEFEAALDTLNSVES